MSLGWPNHPLYDHLCKKASILLPNLDFKTYKVEEGKISFISIDKLIITVQHGGYDMPYILIGNKKDLSICNSWVLLEYYLDKEVPIYKKHQELKSYYDFEYDYDLLKNHYSKILEITKSPKNYLEWEKNTDILKIFENLKNQN